MSQDAVSALQNALNSLEKTQSPIVQDPISLGSRAIDDALSGGLIRAGLHDIYSAGTAHISAATGFAAALASRAAGPRPILWVRQDFLDSETGRLNASGLAELGLDPACIILVRARDIEGVLRAAEQAARCPSLGAVLIEPWGEPKMLDFTASRRLSLASAKSGVPAFMLRVSASPAQSAAATRWKVQALPSQPLEANAPGFPMFELSLLRHRGGVAGQVWRVEWHRDQKCFQDQSCSGVTPVSRPVVPVFDDRQIAPQTPQYAFRRAG